MTQEEARRKFETLICARSGLSMRPQEGPLLVKALSARMQALKLRSEQEYLALLEFHGPASEREWRHLFILLTNQETYFFRDPGQLTVLKQQILPELVRRHQHSRTLRIWSAGCSTGEEPYTLAMMLDDVLPPGEEWHVLILATDISESALARAQMGQYGTWSFRTPDAQMQERYFVQCGNKWEVRPYLKKRVTFALGNLLHDDYPTTFGDLREMDLILCRNVFIYFSREAVVRVLQKMAHTLRPEGFLVAGHAEVHNEIPPELQPTAYPQTVVYRRVMEGAAKFQADKGALKIIGGPVPPLVRAPGPAPKPIPRVERPVVAAAQPPEAIVRPKLVPVPALNEKNQPVLPGDIVTGRAREFLRQGRHQEALELLLPLAETGAEAEHRLEALCLAAQSLANQGKLETADDLCQRAKKLAPLASLPYLISARIAGEKGETEAAKGLLKQVIYLNPASIRAYLELSSLYAGQGDEPRAKQFLRSAFAALEQLSPGDEVPLDPYAVEPPLKVAELKRQLLAEYEAEKS